MCMTPAIDKIEIFCKPIPRAFPILLAAIVAAFVLLTPVGDASAQKKTCIDCHQDFKDKSKLKFVHDPFKDCETCHTTEGDLSAYTCYGCHEHTPRNIRSEHLEEGIREFEACEDCHRSGDEEEAERAWKKMRRKEKNRSPRTSRRSERRHHDDDHDDDDDEHRERDDDD